MHQHVAHTRIALLAAALVLAACESPTQPAPDDQPVVTITAPAAEVRVGQSIALTAVVQNATNLAVTWRSLTPATASVSATGMVTGVAPGSAQIAAISVQDTTARATVSLTVTGGIVPPGTLGVVGHGPVTERYTSEIAVRGDWAYTSTWGNRLAPGNTVKVWNVSGATPQLVDSLRITGATTTGDVQISDDGSLLVVAVEPDPNGAIVIYDRTTPSQPTQLSRFASSNTTQGVHTVKLGRVAGRHYAFLSIDPRLQPARLVIVDITDPRNPVEVFSQQMGNPYVHDVFVRDGLLFTALWNDGLRIFDIGGGGRGGSPAAPVVLGEVRTATGRIHNIWWFHDPVTGLKKYAFLGEEGLGSVSSNTASGDIHVIDVSDLAAPFEVAVYSVSGAGTHNFWMDEQSGVLYAAYYNGGVRAIDVRGDLRDCRSDQRTSTGLCDLRLMGRELGTALTDGSAFVWGVVHQGTFVYASDMKAGIYKLDAAALKR